MKPFSNPAEFDHERFSITVKAYLESAHLDELNGTDLQSIANSLTGILTSYPSRYGDITCEDIFFDIAHDALMEMLSPAAISQAEIGKDFLVGYEPLDYLRAAYPLSNGEINPNDKSRPEFTVHISNPNTL